MTKSLLKCAGIAMAAVSVLGALPAEAAETGFKRPEPLAFARKASPKNIFTPVAEMNLENLRKKTITNSPDFSLDISDEVGYLYGPNNEIWYYVAKYDIQLIPHEYYTEKKILGFTYTIYDSTLKEIGKIHDKIHFKDGEVSASAVSLDPQITKKFFNNDDRYEVVVGLALVTGDHVVHTYSLAYSLGSKTDDEGNNAVIAEIPGYIIDAVDTATDRWNERFFITFMTEAEGNVDDYDNYLDFLATYRIVLTTYKYGGYSAPAPISTIDIPMVCMPGDGMSTPFLFSKKGADGKYYIFTQQYEKSFFVDPTGMGGNEALTPDNSLIIQPYTIDGPSATALTPGTPTVIKVEKHPDYLCSYYGLGNMMGDDDVDFTINGTCSNPVFYVTVQNYTSLADESYTSMYYMYDAQGNRKSTLAEYAEALVRMSDIKGHDPEVLFITPNLNTYDFNFVNIRTGQKSFTVSSTFNGLNLTTNIDRRPVGDSYEYVCEVRNGHENADGTYTAYLGIIGADGTAKPNEEINIGKDVAYAQFYIYGPAMSPYTFNTDDNHEYMALVKRYTDITTGSANIEELVVVSDNDDQPLLVAGPDENKGNLSSILLTGEGTSRRLMVVYIDDDYRFVQDLYNLPLTCFDGGDGTAENPYAIATVADLQAIIKDKNAHYQIVKDFDAANYDFECIDQFNGVLDGGYHTISNLTLSHASGHVALFSYAQGAEIRNLNFKNASVELNSNNLYSGLLAGSFAGNYATGAEFPTGAVIDDVHVYGLNVVSNDFDDAFGGLVGRLALASTITNSYVKDAHIWLPNGSAAGLAGEMLTGSGIKTSAFNGNISAGYGVGGIAVSAAKTCTLSNNRATGYLVADNTIGGILATSERADVNHNIFYGCITAKTPSRWTSGVNAGGIIGQLDAPTTEDTQPDAVCVSNNIAEITQLNVPTLTGTEQWPGQFTTAHRIVGWTRVNARLYDETEKQADPDKGLSNNYATGLITGVIDSSVAAAENTPEGATLALGDFNSTFLAGLGFSHGTTAATPWNTTAQHPNLHFENSIVIETPVVSVQNLANTFNVPITVTSRVPLTEDELFGDLVVDSDESHVEMTGNYTYNGRTLAIELRPLKQGVSKFTVSTCGSTASTYISTGGAGVDDIIADDDANAPVEYFNLQGVRLDNPTPGTVIIRRQGSTVTKVLIK